MAKKPSDEPVPQQLKLMDSDGKTASIDVIERRDGSRYLRLVSSDKWSYRSFGGLVKSRAATRPFSDREFEALQRLLGMNK
jgi:hypothetical protein